MPAADGCSSVAEEEVVDGPGSALDVDFADEDEAVAFSDGEEGLVSASFILASSLSA